MNKATTNMNKNFGSLRTSLVAVLFLALLAACDGGSDAQPDGPDTGTGSMLGSAEVTISGAIERTFSGSAFFSPDGAGTFGMVLVNGTPGTVAGDNYLSVVFSGENRPTGGASIGGDEGLYTLYTEVKGGDAFQMAVAEEGALTLSTSSSTRMVGQFEFVGVLLDGDLEELGEVTIRGNFDARSHNNTSPL